MFPSQQSTA